MNQHPDTGKVLPFGPPKDYPDRRIYVRRGADGKFTTLTTPSDCAPDLHQLLQSSRLPSQPQVKHSAGRPEARKSATMSYREIIRHAWAEFRDFMLDNPRVGYPIVLAAGIFIGLAAIAIPSLILTGRIVF